MTMIRTSNWLRSSTRCVVREAWRSRGRCGIPTRDTKGTWGGCAIVQRQNMAMSSSRLTGNTTSSADRYIVILTFCAFKLLRAEWLASHNVNVSPPSPCT